MRWLTIPLALALGAAALAQSDVEGFEDPAQNERYRDFLHTLRCPQCTNQSVAESPGGTADDIKRLVRERMAAGQTDAEIRAYLVSRYGDVISYRPPFKPSTWLLWLAPALLLAGGGFVFARILRTRMQQPLDEDLDS